MAVFHSVARICCSRAYKKNDQAHVEEKSGSIVRRLIGYDRYEGIAAWRDLTALYAALRLFVNFFQPSLKLLDKCRTGGKTKKKYDKAMTPCQRLLLSPHVPDDKKQELNATYLSLDPVILLREVEILQDRFWRHAWQTTDPITSHAVETSCAEVAVLGPQSNEIKKSAVEGTLKRTYRKSGKPHKPHTWRTRTDPFENVRERLRLIVKLNPHITAKELLQILQREEPGKFENNLLRTLQRRLREWRYELITANRTETVQHISSVILLESTNVNSVLSIESTDL